MHAIAAFFAGLGQNFLGLLHSISLGIGTFIFICAVIFMILIPEIMPPAPQNTPADKNDRRLLRLLSMNVLSNAKKKPAPAVQVNVAHPEDNQPLIQVADGTDVHTNPDMPQEEQRTD